MWRITPRRFTAFTVLALAGAVFCAVYFGGRAESGIFLEIRGADSPKLYGRWPIGEAGEFAVEFIHSVNQSPVRESYRVEGGMIRSLAVRFSSFGAGMQSDLEEGQSLSRDGDAMIITGFKTIHSELNYIVGTVSDHLLLVNGQVVSLRELCGRNAHIKLSIK